MLVDLDVLQVNDAPHLLDKVAVHRMPLVGWDAQPLQCLLEVRFGASDVQVLLDGKDASGSFVYLVRQDPAGARAADRHGGLV
eukprot:CAMPEP_0195116458 /NCGR_PEP_ID=MMETSP0448-20130528/111971_1 /TAXON_ID=66468 /ORGANISM="Heterocapsa triquestra, Strain CCMP 448" /LENGTH=82 /DNA_ID=CAMNT_0040153619 /DNA_START=102 /DNA_END=347 /DNA_ORIENTATION=-